MKPAIPPTSNPANTYNPVENTGIFQRVPSVSGVSGLTETDPWKAKLPPKLGQTKPAKAGIAISALSAPLDGPALVPLNLPFVDGQRYREAGATELGTRLDLYLADHAGPWIRRHGVLIAASLVPSINPCPTK